MADNTDNLHKNEKKDRKENAGLWIDIVSLVFSVVAICLSATAFIFSRPHILISSFYRSDYLIIGNDPTKDYFEVYCPVKLEFTNLGGTIAVIKNIDYDFFKGNQQININSVATFSTNEEMFNDIVFIVNNNLSDGKPLTIEPNTIKPLEFSIRASFPNREYSVVGKEPKEYKYEEDSLIYVKLKIHFIDGTFRNTRKILCTDAQEI